MKAIFSSSSSDLVTMPTFIKIITFSLLSISMFFLFKHISETHPSTSLSFSSSPPVSTSAAATAAAAAVAVVLNTSTLRPPPVYNYNPTMAPPPTPVEKLVPVVERTGIIDENGIMTDDFVIGEYDSGIIENVVDSREDRDEKKQPRAIIDKYKACDGSMSNYIPCLENGEVVSSSNMSERGVKYENHCPRKGKELECSIPRPKGYKIRIPWPKSRDAVWSDNLPQLTGNSQRLISRKKDKFVFPGGGKDLANGANQYLDQISQMVPDIAFGLRTRAALDIGSGIATFGAYLLQRNVTALSIASKDVHDNQIQLALERGVPAMLAALDAQRLLFPSQAFDFIHCSSCGIDWTVDDGIRLLEVNRVLRAGGYFVYSHKDNVEQWKEMKNLGGRICWELVKNEGHISIWKKPINNSCYVSREVGVQPPICDASDDPENVWETGLKACITALPQNGYGANVSVWPARLHHPPDRLFSIKMDAELSRKEIYRAASKYWNDILSGYVRAFHWKKLGFQNVMDMKAGYGGFAAALHDFDIKCWIMNVVPVSGSNTLPVIYDRGFIGVMHDWCLPFNTYPRTYDLLNAAGLFSAEEKRCDIAPIMLEMDRILRPGGRAFIRDTTAIIHELHEISKAMGWVCFLYDTGEGPHASWRLLNCEKRF